MEPRQATTQQTLDIEGTFDRIAAAALRVRLAESSAAEIVIDFTRARDVPDTGLASLVQALDLAIRPRVRIRGLSRHHGRVLRYLGLEPRPDLAF